MTSQLDDLIGNGEPLVMTDGTFSYPPPAYPKGTVVSQPYWLVYQGALIPYTELEPVFFENEVN